MTLEELQARALTEAPVYWRGQRCIRVHELENGKIWFLTWSGGFTYNTTREQWNTGNLLEVH